MNTIQKGKWQVRVAALLIFVIGFAAGALALNVYKRWGRTGAASLEKIVLTECSIV